MADLPYVFGWPFLKLDDNVRNDSGMYFDVVDWMEEDIEKRLNVKRTEEVIETGAVCQQCTFLLGVLSDGVLFFLLSFSSLFS